MKTPCVRTQPLNEIVSIRELSHRELGRMYSERFTPGSDSSATVVRLLNSPLIPTASADKMAILLDTHPLLVWGAAEWDNPIYVEGGIGRGTARRKELEALV